MKNALGKAYRDGMSVIELMNLFPTEKRAVRWFEDVRWAGKRTCGKCGSERTRTVKGEKPMPHWCSDCRSYFSVRTGTPLACSKIPLRKWAVAIYLCLTSLKSVSSMKLHRDLGIGQKAAWFMLHRIREAWARELDAPFSGPVEADETAFGGKHRNMSKSKRAAMTGRGTTGMTMVAGVKDRPTNQVSAAVVRATDVPTLSRFVLDRTESGAKIYTDEAGGYRTLPNRQSVTHSVGEYVRGMAHTNGIESFWSMLKRAYKGTFHKISPKHLDRYVHEFAGKHNIRESGTLTQMRATVAALVGHRLLYRDLIADNGLCLMGRA